MVFYFCGMTHSDGSRWEMQLVLILCAPIFALAERLLPALSKQTRRDKLNEFKPAAQSNQHTLGAKSHRQLFLPYRNRKQKNDPDANNPNIHNFQKGAWHRQIRSSRGEKLLAVQIDKAWRRWNSSDTTWYKLFSSLIGRLDQKAGGLASKWELLFALLMRRPFFNRPSRDLSPLFWFVLNKTWQAGDERQKKKREQTQWSNGKISDSRHVFVCECGAARCVLGHKPPQPFSFSVEPRAPTWENVPWNSMRHTKSHCCWAQYSSEVSANGEIHVFKNVS